MSAVTFGSVCSGIEAASVAWHPLGWRAAWLAEIEPFPSAVLAHHYPDVPNLGDMRALPALIADGKVEAPDVFCGGTPCQAFSVAGLHRSLGDERGNLSLIFCEIADAIDTARAAAGRPAAVVFWENVPGVLSTSDNAFGCFLAALAGLDSPIDPGRIGWTGAGLVTGPARAVAWRILDAQFFGVAQRRRRVFVVASARDGFDPAAVLFEFDGVRRDSAPRREKGEVSAPTVAGCSNGGGANGPGRDVDSVESLQVITMAHGQGGAEIGFDRGPTLTCIHEAPIAAYPATTHTLRGEGFDASEDGTGRGTPLVPVAAALTASRSSTQCPNEDTTLVPVAFHPTQDPISSTDGTTHCMGTGSKQGAATVAVAFNIAPGKGELKDDIHITVATTSKTLDAAGSNPAMHQGGTAILFQPAVAFTSEQTPKFNADCALMLTKQSPTGGGQPPAVMTSMQVRRLTPTECERLQGFPDGYTAIPWRGKPADQCPDGPRYKALGNSWAVPVVRWIGERLDAALRGAT